MRDLEKGEELPWLLMLSATDFRKKKPDGEILSELEEWAVNKDQVREALSEWETLSANKENRKLYEARKKELMDLLSNIDGAERLGKERGIEQGIKEGKKEVALKMLKDGLEIPIISKYTGLTEDDIKKLTTNK